MVKVAYKEPDAALENKSSINRKCKPASPRRSKAYKNKSITMLNQAKAICNAEFVSHSGQTNTKYSTRYSTQKQKMESYRCPIFILQH